MFVALKLFYRAGPTWTCLAGSKNRNGYGKEMKYLIVASTQAGQSLVPSSPSLSFNGQDGLYIFVFLLGENKEEL